MSLRVDLSETGGKKRISRNLFFAGKSRLNNAEEVGFCNEAPSEWGKCKPQWMARGLLSLEFHERVAQTFGQFVRNCGFRKSLSAVALALDSRHLPKLVLATSSNLQEERSTLLTSSRGVIQKRSVWLGEPWVTVNLCVCADKESRGADICEDKIMGSRAGQSSLSEWPVFAKLSHHWERRWNMDRFFIGVFKGTSHSPHRNVDSAHVIVHEGFGRGSLGLLSLILYLNKPSKPSWHVCRTLQRNRYRYQDSPWLCNSGKKRAQKLKKIPRTPARFPWDPWGTNRGLQAGVPGISCCLLLKDWQRRTFLQGHRPGVLGKPGRPGACQKFYLIYSHVPFLLPSNGGPSVGSKQWLGITVQTTVGMMFKGHPEVWWNNKEQVLFEVKGCSVIRSPIKLELFGNNHWQALGYSALWNRKKGSLLELPTQIQTGASRQFSFHQAKIVHLE